MENCVNYVISFLVFHVCFTFGFVMEEFVFLKGKSAPFDFNIQILCVVIIFLNCKYIDMIEFSKKRARNCWICVYWTPKIVIWVLLVKKCKLNRWCQAVPKWPLRRRASHTHLSNAQCYLYNYTKSILIALAFAEIYPFYYGYTIFKRRPKNRLRT